jgi:hypothetical protein
MPAFRRLANSIVPDYSKPIQELYIEMVLLSVQEDHNLDALSFAQHRWPLHRDGFPSWVPQWDNRYRSRSILATYPPDIPWQASGCLLDRISVSRGEVEKSVLSVLGFHFDTVVAKFEVKGKPLPDPEALQKLLTTLGLMHDGHRGRIAGSSYPTGEDKFAALYLTLICGVYQFGRQLRRAEQHIDIVQSEFYWLLREPPGAPKPMIVIGSPMYYDLASTFCSGRRFFTTQNGWIGLGPEKLQPGDKVCIFNGGKVPYILRLTEDYHQFLGDCYVHGIMDGEAAAMCAAGCFKEEYFKLR